MELDLKNYRNRHSLKSKIARAAWNVVWLLLFRPTPRGKLFRPWRIALLKLFGAKVKWTSNVLPSCRIWQPWKLAMKNVSAWTIVGGNPEKSVKKRILDGEGVILFAAFPSQHREAA